MRIYAQFSQNPDSILNVIHNTSNLVVFYVIPEINITYKKVETGLNNRNINNVKDALENLFKCQEFTYIADFVNTIKHRHLIDTDYRLEIGVDTKNTRGIRFIKFIYDTSDVTRNHDTCFAKEIINNYEKVIVPLISKVGKEIEISLSR